MHLLPAILAQPTLSGVSVIVSGIAVWVYAIHRGGNFSEKRWGDRESGALLGFFIPGALVGLAYYLMKVL